MSRGFASAAGGDAPTLSAADIDPLLLRLGLLVSILEAADDLEPPQQVRLNVDWFSSPWSYLRAIPDHGRELVAFVAALLDVAAGDSIGAPSQVDGRLWYAIPVEVERGAPPLPFYLVSEPVGDDGVVVGLGLMADVAVGPATVTPTVFCPILALPIDGDPFVLGHADHPLELGLVVADQLTLGGASLAGIGLTASFTTGAAPAVSLVVRGAAWPGRAAGDLTLTLPPTADGLASFAVRDWISLGVTLLVGEAAEQLDPARAAIYEQMTADLLALAGLSGDLPAVDWGALATHPSAAPRVLAAWLGALVASPAAATAWLARLSDLLAPSPTAPVIAGAGTPADPWLAPLPSPTGLRLALTMATRDHAGTRHVELGVQVASAPVVPLTAAPSLGVSVVASLVMIDLVLPAPGTEPPPLAERVVPGLGVEVVLASPTAGQPLVAVPDGGGGATVSLGGVRGGLRYAVGGDGARRLTPCFALTDVVTPARGFAEVGLDQLGAVVDVGLAAVVQAAVRELFGDAAAGLTADLAAVLGLAAPPGLAGAWPVELLIEQPHALVSRPLAALAGYWGACLDAAPGAAAAPAPLTALVTSLAGTLAPGVTAHLTGTGAVDDPWQVALASASGVEVALQVWCADRAARRLCVGLAASVPLTAGSLSATVEARAALVELTLPASVGGAGAAASWLPGAHLALILPDPLPTYRLGGVGVGADRASLSLDWARGHRLMVGAALDGLEVHLPGAEPVKISDLHCSLTGSTDWSKQLGTLAQAAVAALGLELIAHGDRIGVAVAALLGLVPSLDQILDGEHHDYAFPYPEGLDVTGAWPHLTITDPEQFFSAPGADLRTQLAGLIASSEVGDAAARLLAWAVTGALPPAVDPVPAGSFDDPWVAPLGPVDLLLWNAGGGLGVSVRRGLGSGAAGPVAVTGAARVDGWVFDLTGSATTTTAADATRPALPRVSAAATLTAAGGGPLVPAPGGGASGSSPGLSIGAAVFGAHVDPTGLFPELAVTDATCPPGFDQPTRFALSAATVAPRFTVTPDPAAMEQLLAAVGGRLAGVTAATGPVPAALVGLLTDVALLDAPPAPGGAPSFSTAAWRALLANPGAYLADRASRLLADSTARARFLGHVATLIGVESVRVPASLDGLPALLAGFGLIDRVPGPAPGYAITLAPWLALIADPIGYVREHGAALLADDGALTALVTALAAAARTAARVTGVDVPAPPPPRSSLTTGADAQVTLAAAPWPLGSQLSVAGALSLAPHTRTLELSITLAATALDVAVEVTCDLAPASGGSSSASTVSIASRWGVALVGTGPATFHPIPLYPPPDDPSTRTDRLAIEIPRMVLSTVLTIALDTYVLPHYPAVGRALAVLGLATGDPPEVGSLTPVLRHPLAWLRSPAGLGDGDGGVDLTRLGRLAAAIPGPGGLTGPGGVTLTASGDTGVAVGGLPYGVALSLSADTPGLATIAVAATPTVEGTALDLQAGVTIGGGGAAVTGALGATFTLDGAGDALAVDVAYGTAGFTVAARPTIGGHAQTRLVLYPFAGFAATGTALADYLLAALGQAWQRYLKGGHPDRALVDAVATARATAEILGVTDGPSALKVAEQIVADPARWLLSLLVHDQATHALTGIQQLLAGPLGLPGFSIDDGKLAWKPAGADAPLVEVGYGTVADPDVLGVWLTPSARYEWFVAGISAGVGVVPTGESVGDPQVSFELSLGVDVAAAVAQVASAAPAAGPTPTLVLHLSADPSGLRDHALTFYPAGPDAGPGPHDDALAIMLVPRVALAHGDPPVPTSNTIGWLVELGVQVLGPLIADAILASRAVAHLLATSIAGSKVPVGQVLAAWKLVAPAADRAGRYVLADLGALAHLGPADVLHASFTALLAAAPPAGLRLVTVGHGGVYLVGDPDQPRVGVRLTLADLGLPALGSAAITLQLGAWPTGDTAGDNWIERAGGPAYPAPGLIAYLVGIDGAGNPALQPRLALVSVGFDLMGAGDHPLFAWHGVQLGGLEPRVLVDIDFARPDHPTAGAAVRLDGIGLPLGPALGGAASVGSNPVAASLLSSSTGSGTSGSSGSGSGGGDDGDDGGARSANPTFGVSAGYVYPRSFEVQLYGDPDQPGDPTSTVWFDVQRSLGPLYLARLGVEWKQSGYRLGLMFDGSLSLFGLTVSVVDLSLSLDVSHPLTLADYQLGLRGLGVDFEGGSVELTGAFLKDDGHPPGYDGLALAKVQSVSVALVGSWAVLHDWPSLFLFGQVTAPIGGPPYFQVTGLAAGFGINRKLILPPPGQVAQFALVQAVTDPGAFQDGAGHPSPTMALQALADTVPPALGGLWLAAGIQFTVCQLIPFEVLAVVEIGAEWAAALLGFGRLILPTTSGSQSGSPGFGPYIDVELGVDVVANLSSGELDVSGNIGPTSYLLTPDCQPTGAFALCLWFPVPPPLPANPHAGDFVLSVGGYSPRFPLAEHWWYPKLAPLGITWPVGHGVVVSGTAYFALTPSCAMAGGSLRVSYDRGSLHAWLTAGIDAVVGWCPFWYSVPAHASVGVKYTAHVLVKTTIHVELGATLELYGPPFRGDAEIHASVVSFHVHFGASDKSDAPPALTWRQFRDTLLPGLSHHDHDHGSGPPPDPDAAVVRTAVRSGLRARVDQADGPAIAVVRSDGFEVDVDTAIPVATLTCGATYQGEPVGVRPMGALPGGALGSTLDVTVTYLDRDMKVDLTGWNVAATTRAVPASLWSLQPAVGDQPSAELLDGRTCGVTLAPPPPPPEPPLPLDPAILSYYDWQPDYPLPLAHPPPPPPPLPPPTVPPGDALATVEATVMKVAGTRAAVVAALADLGTSIDAGRLDLMAAYAEATFAAEPRLGPLGTTGTTGVAVAARRAVTVRAAPLPPRVAPAAPARVARVRAAVRRHPWSGGVHPLATTGIAAVADARASLAARRALSRHALPSLALRPGAALLIDLGDDPSIDLACDGALPLHLAALDRHHHVLTHELIAPGAAATRALPPATRHLAIAAALPGPRGWHGSSALFAVAPTVLLGAGALVRVQAPLACAGPALQPRRPIVSGRELVAHNRAGAGAGWLSTRIAAADADAAGGHADGADAIELHLRPPPGAAPDPDAAARAVALSDVAGGAVAPSATAARDGTVVLTCPAAAELLVQAGGGWIVDGVAAAAPAWPAPAAAVTRVELTPGGTR